MSMTYISTIPDDFLLVKTSYDSTEAHFICGLLESNGIEVYMKSEGYEPHSGELDGVIPKHNIFVNQKFFIEAQKLLNDPKAEDDQEWTEFKNYKKPTGIFSYALGILLAFIFYALSFLELKGPEIFVKYICYGAALVFLVLTLRTFYNERIK